MTVRNSNTGLVHTRFHTEADALVVERVQDVEPVIEQANTIRQMRDGKLRDFHHVGTVPNVVLEMWRKEDPDIMRNPAKVAAKLREYNKFATVSARYLPKAARRAFVPPKGK